MTERGLERDEAWLQEKLRVIRDTAPMRRASLKQLLDMERPFVETRGGGKHFFSRQDLKEAASRLPAELLEATVFPIVFIKGDVEGVYLIRDPDAAEVFSRLSETKLAERLPSGEYYTYKSLVLRFLARYPSLGVITG